MSLPIYHVDAFVTKEKFSGNPAGVCILSQTVEDDWMRKVAREMNLSETAFLVKHSDGYNLRWFTPTVEVVLCGHATLASAHTLWEMGYLKPNTQARFYTKSGLLTADQKGELIELNFPAKIAEPTSPPVELLNALGVKAAYIGKNQFDYLIEVDSEQTVRDMKPDFTSLKKISVRGVIVTSRSDSLEYDFVSRFFAPGSGIDEDPVTGSAHCCLGPYWKSRLGKNEFAAYQASPRGGVLRVHVDGDRVYLTGKSVTMIRGELL